MRRLPHVFLLFLQSSLLVSSASPEAESLYLEARSLSTGLGGVMDVKKADELYKKASALGDPRALAWNCRRMARGERGFPKDMEEAKRSFRKIEDALSRMASSNLPDAKRSLAVSWATLFPSEKGKAGFDLLKQLLDEGRLDDLVSLARCYEDGIGVEKNPSEAFLLYRKSAEQGNVGAMGHLGDCYREGWGVSKNETEAFRWYQKAAPLGSEGALRQLAFCYESGLGVKKNPIQAFANFLKLANQDNAWAQNRVGWCLANGVGVPKDPAKAIPWYQKSAQSGNEVAMGNLGFCYEKGQGVAQDEKEAVRWYDKAAVLGHTWSMNQLGLCYENGRGVEKDPQKAFEFYLKSAEAGDAWGQKTAGHCYRNGFGTAQDYAKAFDWYQKSADQGDLAGLESLALCFLRGQGVEKNSEEALRYFQKAAEKGSAWAQAETGRCYLEGVGTKQDKKISMDWFRKAAVRGNHYGEAMYGKALEEGWDGVLAREEALGWYRKSAEGGNGWAWAALGQALEKETLLRDMEEVFRCYQKANWLGDSWGTLLLAKSYAGGIGVEPNPALAADLAERLIGTSQDQAARKLLVDLHWGGGGAWPAANLEKGMEHWLVLYPRPSQRLSAIYRSAMDLIRAGRPGSVADVLALFEAKQKLQNLTSPQDEYLQIYVLINDGDKLSINGQASQAREKYEIALSRLEKVKNENPEWEPTIVKYRLKYLNEKLAGFKFAKETKKSVKDLPNPIESPSSPSPPAFSGDLRVFRAVTRLMADRQVPKSWNWAVPSYLFPSIERLCKYFRDPSGGNITVSSGHLEIYEKSAVTLGRFSPQWVADLWGRHLQWFCRLLSEEESGWYGSFVRSMERGEKAVNLRWLQSGVSRKSEAGKDLTGVQPETLSLGGVGGGLLISRLSENSALVKGLMARLDELDSKEFKKIQKNQNKQEKGTESKPSEAYTQIRGLGESPEFAPQWWREKGELSFGWGMSSESHLSGFLVIGQIFPFRQVLDLINAQLAKTFLRARPDLVLKVGAYLEKMHEDPRFSQIGYGYLEKAYETLASEVPEYRRRALEALVRWNRVQGNGVTADQWQEALIKEAAPKGGSSEFAQKPKIPKEFQETANRANSLYSSKKYEEAVKAYEEILQKYPDSLYALSNLGVVRFQQQKYSQAESALRKAVALSSNDAFSHSVLGIVLVQEKKYQEALEILRRAVRLAPEDAKTRNYLGISCSRLGLQKEAERECRKAIELNETYGDAHFNLAVIYGSQNPPAKDLARRHYQRALELGIPKDKELEKLIQ